MVFWIKSKMKIKMIVCCEKNGGIGFKGGLPWTRHFKNDMKNFMNITKGHGVVMGKNTWFSLPEKHRPLKGRTNYIISSTLKNEYARTFDPNVHVYDDVETCIAAAQMDGIKELWVIGGFWIYESFFQNKNIKLNELWVTRVDKEYDADVWFPLYRLQEYTKAMEFLYKENGVNYSINVFN